MRVGMIARGIALAAMLGASGAPAAYKSRTVEGWTVAASKDAPGCFVSRTYDHPGDTTLLLGLDADGSNHLSILNANWSIKPDERLKLDFRLSGSAYPKHFAIGLASDGKQGFVTSFGPDFPALFAKSRTLQITRGVTPVERLDLTGGDTAVTELRGCVKAQADGSGSAKAGTSRRDSIPLDPFARGDKRGK